MKILKEDCREGRPAPGRWRMPGEFEPHEGCLMIWPCRPGSWNYGAREAQEAFVRVAEAIGESERIYMLVSEAEREKASRALEGLIKSGRAVLLPIETDDAWARDVGPTVVVDAQGERAGIDW